MYAVRLAFYQSGVIFYESHATIYESGVIIYESDATIYESDVSNYESQSQILLQTTPVERDISRTTTLPSRRV